MLLALKRSIGLGGLRNVSYERTWDRTKPSPEQPGRRLF
jgi:hypothetical protein